MLLLGVGCASGSPPATRPSPAPAPTSPSPGTDPVRVEPTRDLLVRYPRAGGGIVRYAFVRRDSVVATMPSGETQVQILGRTAFVTLTWVASDSGTRITASVDSVIPDPVLGDLGPMLDSARLSRWSGLRRPSGKLGELTGGPGSLAGDQIRDQLALLFPILPADGARPGTTWTDTTSGLARVSAFEATETALVASRAEAMMTATGALPLAVVRTRSATGQGTQFGQPMTLKATGSDTLAYQIAPDGRVVNVDGIRVTDLVVELSAIGQSVPAHERSVLRMSLLR